MNAGPPRRSLRARNTLGTRLAWDAGLCMAASLLLFAAVTLLSLYLDMRHDGTGSAGSESAFVELIEQLGWASLIAAPLATAFAVLTARWAARRATARLDALIASAAGIDLDSIDARLPEPAEDDEIGQLARALNSLLARIDSGIAAQRQFAADASHELRTPLAVIINALEVARRRDRTAPQWEAVADQVLGDAQRMAGLVQALLHVARPDEARGGSTAITLAEVFESLAARWKLHAPGLALHFDAAPALAVCADARALEIVFDNLLSNAVAHARPQGQVRIVARREGELVRIAIEDDGPGVPPAEQRRIFEAFARGAHAADRDAARPGVGLGLSIVRRIVEASQGRIFVDEGCASGARFVIEFSSAPA
jgi:two-component system, OmpR family, sensor kinase